MISLLLSISIQFASLLVMLVLLSIIYPVSPYVPINAPVDLLYFAIIYSLFVFPCIPHTTILPVLSNAILFITDLTLATIVVMTLPSVSNAVSNTPTELIVANANLLDVVGVIVFVVLLNPPIIILPDASTVIEVAQLVPPVAVSIFIRLPASTPPNDVSLTPVKLVYLITKH